MSTQTQEAPPRAQEASIAARVTERPSLKLSRVRDVRGRDLGIRFAAGALTSIASGLLSLVLSPRIGGLFLAFPAILAASLTLIEEQEDSAEAREDARGAVLGGTALAVFAAVAALALGHLPGAVALLVAAAAWFAWALAGYLLAWLRR